MNTNDPISRHEERKAQLAGPLACNDTMTLEEFACCEAERVQSMTLEAVEAELRCRGIDPERALERVRKCMEEIRCCGEERHG